MCGISGICATTPLPQPNLETQLENMARLMFHRGPDDGGHWVAPSRRCGLANRRLAIIDLSPAGHMPMTYGDHLGITYNGEIYNFADVRAELVRVGHTFQSNGDTEVILHAYKEWGKECVSRLRGMFALAIWDDQKHTLFLARDRLGIKPVYYTVENNHFYFASELTALGGAAVSRDKVDPTAVVAYLHLGAVPNPLTIYQDVIALPPGYHLTWTSGHITLERYWDIPHDVQLADHWEAVDKIGAVLAEAVKIRMVADVPLGAFLSGGLDSSSVVALMRRNSNDTIRTCSITFNEDAYNEGSFAKQVAQAFETDHQERLITGQDVVTELDNIIAHMDQPTIDGVNTYFVSKVARETGLRVALSGLGGDELFAGYPSTFMGVPSLYNALRAVHQIPGVAYIARAGLAFMPSRWERLSEALVGEPSRASSYLTRRGVMSAGQIRHLLQPDVYIKSTFDPVEYIRCASPHSDLDFFYWVSQAELRTYTHNQLLRDTDVMSMAHSLEVRVPLLDHKLVETIHSLPANYHRSKGINKNLLRMVLRDRLPAEILNRRDKQGFTFPFARWMLKDLKTTVQDALSPYQIASTGVLDAQMVQTIQTQFENGKLHWSRLWSLAVLNLWLSAKGLRYEIEA